MLKQKSSALSKRSRAHLATLFCTLSSFGACASAELSFHAPDAAFAQLGAADNTYGATVGVNWNWGREFRVGSAHITGYWEASASQWSYPVADVRRTAGLVQLGLIPVFRWSPSEGASPWFAEAGIGATLTTVAYQTDRKRFSTRFNFGDHLAVGRSFGASRAHELSLRLEHFSNGGLKQPNPGENFVQIRYLYKLK
ncbi:MAG: acyloxyacyl hydrolase [Pseudorhodobacter sp.]|nr:acyloxyacyl hydrolase [Rhizobacter sp.]